jgi:hypothetical protein
MVRCDDSGLSLLSNDVGLELRPRRPFLYKRTRRSQIGSYRPPPPRRVRRPAPAQLKERCCSCTKRAAAIRDAIFRHFLQDLKKGDSCIQTWQTRSN